MSAFEVIQAAAAAELVDEDGDRVHWKPLPGLREEDITALERDSSFKLPRELRDLLPICAGVEGALEIIDFTGRTFSGVELDGFPREVPIAHDGFGNYWVVDVSPEGVAVAPVFFVCHDPPVVLYQAESIAAFLREVVRMYEPPHASLVNDVHEDRLFDVWRKNPGTLTVAEAASRDGALRVFAASLDARFTIVDLREPAVGMGFSWGRHGPRTEVRRCGDLRIFAYGPPMKGSLWSRLIRR